MSCEISAFSLTVRIHGRKFCHMNTFSCFFKQFLICYFLFVFESVERFKIPPQTHQVGLKMFVVQRHKYVLLELDNLSLG